MKPTISSENESEKWRLRQTGKTVPVFKTGKVPTINSVPTTVLGWKWRGRVDGSLDFAQSTDLLRKKIRQKFVIYRSLHID